eukprot:4734959-Pyramimonas_sp.AAC.1
MGDARGHVPSLLLPSAPPPNPLRSYFGSRVASDLLQTVSHGSGPEGYIHGTVVPDEGRGPSESSRCREETETSHAEAATHG